MNKLTLIAISACLPCFGQIVSVPCGGDLQNAINNATAGTEIQVAHLAADGSRCVWGSYNLPVRSDGGYVTIETDAVGNLPPQGTRIQQGDPNLTLFVAQQWTEYGVFTTGGSNSHGWIFKGLELTAPPSVMTYGIVQVYAPPYSPGLTPNDLPSNFDFEHCLIHGTSPDGEYGRGIYFDGSGLTVRDSQIYEIHSTFIESNAILGITGPGNWVIDNNVLQAACENIMLGGAPEIIPNLMPSNIKITHNYISKPLAWRTYVAPNGEPYVIKNLLEFKEGTNVTIDSNVMEYSWAAGQTGFAILLTPRVNGTDPITNYGNTDQNFTITNNIIRHAASGINLSIFDDLAQSYVQPNQYVWTKNIRIQGNLFDDLSHQWAFGSSGITMGLELGWYSNGQINETIEGLVIDHNTFNFVWNYNGVSDLEALWWVNNGWPPVPVDTVVTNNVMGAPPGGDGIGVGPGGILPGMTFQNNLIYDPWNQNYSAWPGNVINAPSLAGAGADTNALAAMESAVSAGVLSASADPPPASGLRFVPVAPCRVADTRNASGPFGGPELAAGSTRNFTIPGGACGIPSSAAAYSLNVTAIPDAKLGYLTIWPSGQNQPVVSTLNSDGRVKANAAIVPAGNSGAVSVFVTDSTQLVLDINGYFEPAGTSAAELQFYPLAPCRIADTRQPTGALGGPYLKGGAVARSFPVMSSACNIPAAAQAYSLNFTAVPHHQLGYLTAWPAGQSQPLISTLNAPTGAVTANAAIVPAGSNGAIQVYASGDTDLVLDINGYFAPAGSAGGLDLFTLAPCRALDTRNQAPFKGKIVGSIAGSACIPQGANAQAFVLNATVVPPAPLGFLTLWPDGEAQPLVSTLNAFDGAITSNMAIVPTTDGSIDAFASGATQLILDVSGYFAPHQ